jgi:hypothetical protein
VQRLVDARRSCKRRRFDAAFFLIGRRRGRRHQYGSLAVAIAMLGIAWMLLH